MGFVANALGGLCAALVPTMANWVAKVPLSRKPWLHAGFFVTGAYLTSIYDGFEQQLLNEVNQTRKEKGLPPIVKNNSMWFPLQEAEVDGKQE